MLKQLMSFQCCMEQTTGLSLILIAIISTMNVNAVSIPHEDVIIIGAGISGFGAATRLLENNMTSFKILEAENKIGGRILSIEMGGSYIDLGAEYVHGDRGNLIFELAKKYMNASNDVDDSKLYYSNEGEVKRPLIQDFFEQISELEKDPGAPNASLYESFSKRYRENILPKYGDDHQMSKIAREFLKTAEYIFLIFEGSFDWHVVRSRFTNFEVYPGNQIQSWSGFGYQKIFEVLREKIGPAKSQMLDDRIYLNKTVKSIITRGEINKTILVECHDGTKMTADHLIFTASLGVLKHEHKKMFQPGLDSAKLEAMENLGIGAIMKVALLFPSSWWKNDAEVYLLWSDEDEENLSNGVPFGPTKDGKHWLSTFLSVTPAPNNTKVLIAWFAGHFVPELEQLSDKKLKEGIMYGMKKFFSKDHQILEPVSMRRSQWFTNPHFRGSWSYETPKVANMKSSPHSDLLKPIEDDTGVPRILFAGEATHPTRFSCADGALASGFIQADKLIRYWYEHSPSQE